MEPRIETLTEKKLVGLKSVMSLARNTTGELWRSFMARRGEVSNAVGVDLYSVQNFSEEYFCEFSLTAEFEKWAAVEVSGDEASSEALVPDGMASLRLSGGLYAVFSYVGPASAGPKVFTYIYGEWIPRSEYELDHRPHFEVLGAKYKGDDPLSEEEIWIPIRARASAL